MKPIVQNISSLPVMQVAGRVNELLAGNGTLVITAPPGAGKSTVLPLTIAAGLHPQPGNADASGIRPGLCAGIASASEGKVLMLEPRRLAARQVATRMASLLGEQPGQTVGYRVRFENKVSARTSIEVITEGILSRMLLEDPALEGVSVLIFDEFHERSLFSDEALALARQTQQILRPDLRIVIMSATIDSAEICRTLSAPLVECSGRCHEVETVYSEQDTEPSSCAEDVARVVVRAHRSHKGDILAFLPGEAEIRKCAELLAHGDPDGAFTAETMVCPLYGMLSFEEQNRAIAPSPKGRRKVVLATPIAETSLTIEGVRVVVDSGLYRTVLYDSQNGQSHLETLRVSKDMADQRAGRAGRVAEGVCYRLYRRDSYRAMKETRVPEILEADLVPLALDLAVWGATDALSLPWLTSPPAWKMAQSQEVLHMIGALDATGSLTASGKLMASYPCHPRVAKMMLAASLEPCRHDGLSDSENIAGKAVLAADMAAILEDRDPLSVSEYGVDIDERLSQLRKARASSMHGGNVSGASGQYSARRWARTILAAKQFRKIAGVPEEGSRDNQEADWYEQGRLLASAWPERVGKASSEMQGRYILASGDVVCMDRDDAVAASDWIVAVSANVRKGSVGRVFLASRVRLTDLLPMAAVVDKVTWSTRENAVVARREWRLGALTLDSRPLADVSRDAVVAAICDAAGKYGTSMLDFSDAVGNLQRRVSCAASWHPELDLPDLSADAVLSRASHWLPLYIGKASAVAELKKIDLEQALWGLLSYEQQQAVERFAPSHVTVPTGSRIRLEYRPGADAPVLRVRLQECFGLTDTPRVDAGRIPVLMELLSPGFKPVQLTSDLASFWSGTYFEVRKELRRRYPKHSWPDNPLEAEAVRGVKRK